VLFPKKGKGRGLVGSSKPSPKTSSLTPFGMDVDGLLTKKASASAVTRPKNNLKDRNFKNVHLILITQRTVYLKLKV
jgi:hypothetical protein